MTWMLNKIGLTTIRDSNLKVAKLQNRVSSLEVDMEQLEDFFNAVYSYHGNYPNWKAQQEFRDLVSNGTVQHADAIDDYLSAVIDATRECMIKRGLKLDNFWETTDKLNNARGQRGWNRVYSND